MDFCKQFKYIIKIYEHGSVSEAAESIGISQPALSKYIRNVEKELGTEIFDRSKNPLDLTEAGKCYIEVAKKVIYENQQLTKRVSELIYKKDSEIKIGISPSRAPYLLPVVLREFYKNNENVRIHIEENSVKELNDKLESGQLDLIISLLEDESSKFEYIELFEEKVFLTVPEFCKEKTINEVVNNFPVIISGRGHSIWGVYDKLQRKYNIKTPMIECQNFATALALVENGLGVALLPSYMKKYGKNSHKVGYIKLESEYFWDKRKICLFYKKEEYLCRAERDFIKCTTDLLLD